MVGRRRFGTMAITGMMPNVSAGTRKVGKPVLLIEWDPAGFGSGVRWWVGG